MANGEIKVYTTCILLDLVLFNTHSTKNREPSRLAIGSSSGHLEKGKTEVNTQFLHLLKSTQTLMSEKV